MKLDEHEIRDLVTETERKNASWVAWANEWERLWRLCDFNDAPQDYKDQDGIRSVVMPDPFNVVQLTQRMIADEPRIEVPSLSGKDDDEDRSEVIEEWLTAFDFESNRQQGRNHAADKGWQSATLGKGASRVIWVGDILPQGMQGRLPFLRENIDPRNVGISRTYFGTEWGYHKYDATRAYIERYYPKYELPETNTKKAGQFWNEKYPVVDFWTWHKGQVWHSVVIDGKFALGPVDTDYPDIPIITWHADGAPVADEMGRSLSIIHPIRGPYQAKNDFISTMMTGMEYHYNPLIVGKNLGEQKITVGPGAIVRLSENQSIEPFRPEPNVPMAQNILALLQTGMDQATYPGVVYGDAPGGVNAGFALNNLAQNAQARAKIIRNNIEAAYEAEYQLILGQVEALAPEEGVEIYGRSNRGDRGRPLLLDKGIIKGNYACRVSLMPEQPLADNAQIMTYINLNEKGIVSKTWVRNRGINIPMPRDEELRIAAEQAEMSPQMALKKQLRALQKTRPQSDWELLIIGTELQPIWEQEQQYLQQKKEKQEAAKEQRKAEKMQKEMQEQMANNPFMGMAGSMPPLPPGGMTMPGGMPPLPPQGTPPPDMGMPPGTSMQPSGMAGMPPQMAGQMTPEQLGLPPGAPPGMFQEMMGQPPLSDEEMMRRMGGLPPQV